MNNTEALKTLVCLPVVLAKKPNGFRLYGVITELIDETTFRFETDEKESLIDVEQILELTVRPRTSFEEVCNNCKTGIFYRKTSTDNYCANCKRLGCGCK
jgi:hypothetical protein